MKNPATCKHTIFGVRTTGMIMRIYATYELLLNVEEVVGTIPIVVLDVSFSVVTGSIFVVVGTIGGI